MSASLQDTILFWVQLISLIALVVYVIKTAEVARGTKKSAEATEKSVLELFEERDQEIAPYIVAYFDCMNDSPVFDLVVKNTGKTVATNVVINFDPPLTSSIKDYDIEKLAFIHQPIPTFPPLYEIRAAVDYIQERLSSQALPKVFKVEVSYQGGLKKEIRTAQYILDLNVFYGILETHTRSMNDLTRAIEAIPEKLDEMDKHFSSINKAF